MILRESRDTVSGGMTILQGALTQYVPNNPVHVYVHS